MFREFIESGIGKMPPFPTNNQYKDVMKETALAVKQWAEDNKTDLPEQEITIKIRAPYYIAYNMLTKLASKELIDKLLEQAIIEELLTKSKELLKAVDDDK